MLFGSNDSNGVTTIVPLSTGDTIALRAGTGGPAVILITSRDITMTVNRIN